MMTLKGTKHHVQTVGVRIEEDPADRTFKDQLSSRVGVTQN